MGNWTTAIPLVSAFAAVFSAGVAWATLRNHAKLIEALERRLNAAAELLEGRIIKRADKDYAELRAEHMRSAKDQGGRLEELGKDVGKLLEWRAEERGAERVRRRTAAAGVPVQSDE